MMMISGLAYLAHHAAHARRADRRVGRNVRLGVVQVALRAAELHVEDGFFGLLVHDHPFPFGRGRRVKEHLPRANRGVSTMHVLWPFQIRSLSPGRDRPTPRPRRAHRRTAALGPPKENILLV